MVAPVTAKVVPVNGHNAIFASMIRGIRLGVIVMWSAATGGTVSVVARIVAHHSADKEMVAVVVVQARTINGLGVHVVP